MAYDWDARLNFGKSNSFDVLRFALATFVILEHAYYLPINSPAMEPLYRFSNGQINFGTLAVDLFFVISGFLITRSWLMTHNAWRYLQKRIARIVPGFFIACCAGVIIGALSVHDTIAYFRGINAPIFILKVLSLHQADPHGAFPHNPMPGIVGGTLWTIRYEFDCYLLVAALGILGWLRRMPVTIFFALCAAAYAAQQFGVLKMPTLDTGIPAILLSSPTQWPRLFTYFFVGAAFYLWREKIPKSPVIFGAAFLALVTALRFGALEPVLVIAGTYCVFFIALSVAASIKILGKRVDLSYGAYLFGFPIQQLIISFCPQPMNPLILFAASFCATCLIAYLSWRFIESPCIQWKWLARRSAPVLP